MTHSIPIAIPAEATTKLHQEGRLSQRCPGCGLVEAAGGYCTRCLTKTGPADYFTQSRKGHRTPHPSAVVSHSASQEARAVPEVVEALPASPAPTTALTLGLT